VTSPARTEFVVAIQSAQPSAAYVREDSFPLSGRRIVWACRQAPEARAFASREDDAPTLLVHKLCRHSAKGDFEGPSQRIPTRSFARDRRIDFGISGTAYRYSVVVLMITLDAGARQVSRSSKSRTPSGHEKPLLVFTASGLLLTEFPSHDEAGLLWNQNSPDLPRQALVSCLNKPVLWA
jgi:hypothetical protein